MFRHLGESRLLIALGVDTYAFPPHGGDDPTVNVGLSWWGIDRYICRHNIFANLLLDPLVGARIGHRLLFALFYCTFRHFNGLGCLHMHGLGAGAGTATTTPIRPLTLRQVVAVSMVDIADRLNLLIQDRVLVGVV